MKNEKNVGISIIIPDISSALIIHDLLYEACKDQYNFL